MQSDSPASPASSALLPQPEPASGAPSPRSEGDRDETGYVGIPLTYDDVRRTDEDGRIVVQVPVDIRSMALVVLAVLASLVVLRWAAAVFVPLLLSLMLTYALAPAVEWGFRHHVPRVLSAAVLLLGLLGTGGFAVYWLSGDANNLLNALPVAAQKARMLLHSLPGSGSSPLDTVQKAAQHLEQAASENATPLAARRGVTRVMIEPRPFNIRDYLLTGTIGLAGFLGQMTVVLFLSFFALCAGDTFRRKLVKITGPSLTKKKITIQVLDDITDQIQRYLLVQLLMSALVGVATWLSYWWLGLEYAAVWGLAAGVLNLIPYIGSVAVTAGSALVAFLQFGTLDMALALGGASLVIHTIVGNLLTPWLTSRASSMNPVVIFAAVLAWGWLWGIWGLLLGIPIMMVIKAICDRVEDLKPIGELMGR